MLRGLLRGSEGAKALFEKIGLFKSPELLEKYVIASEVTVEVLDVFLSRVFGTERGCGDSLCDLNVLCECLCGVSFSDRNGTAGGDLSVRSDEPDKVMEGLHGKIEDLERQLCAVRRQLQMQREVSQMAVPLDSRLDEIASQCERQVSDVRSQVSAVSEDVVRLEKEVRDRASTGDMEGLSEEVSRLKAGEKSLADRILGVEKKAMEAQRVMRDELQGEIKRLDTATKLVPVDPLNPGIIAHFTRECGGNVQEKGVVQVTAEDCCHNTVMSYKHIVELGTYFPFSFDGGWVCYDFKWWRVAPTSYSIRSADFGFPKSWVIEVSNDGKEWEVVDRRDDNEDLNGPYVAHTFEICDPPSGSFRFFRLRQTGLNHQGNHYLAVCSLEVFGTLCAQ